MILLGTAIDKAGEKVCEKAGPESESAGDELVTGLQDAVGALIMKVKHSLHPAPLPIPLHAPPLLCVTVSRGFPDCNQSIGLMVQKVTTTNPRP